MPRSNKKKTNISKLITIEIWILVARTETHQKSEY